jgi:hypothetical protein
MTQGQIEKEQEATRSKNISNIQIVNKDTGEEFSVYLQNNYWYKSKKDIIYCDFTQYEYKPAVVINKPAVIRRQFYPKWFNGRLTIDFLDTDLWEIVCN